MLLYNTEWQYDHGMALNYWGKKFYNIEPWKENQGPYSQHFNFSITYEWAQLVIVLVPSKSFQPRAMKRFSLLDPFLSSEENKVL